MIFDYSDKTVFLTGGSGGIGRVIRDSFLNCGADVISPSSKELDLLDRASIDQYLERSQIDADIIIHCAGINRLAGIIDVNGKIVDDVFQVNLFSFIQILNHFAPKMKNKKYGRVIGISSLYGIVSKENRIPYSSSKHAMSGFIKSAAIELAPDNILINGVAPGYVMTEMTKKNLSAEEIENIRKQIPTGKLQEASEIADLCLFLCSPENQSITGQIIPVDGGFLCR